MRYLKIIFNRAIPFYFWVGLVYAVFVIVLALTTSERDAVHRETGVPISEIVAAAAENALVAAEEAGGAAAEVEGAGEETVAQAAEEAATFAVPEELIFGDELYERVELALDEPIVTVPLFSNANFVIDWTVVFIILGFVAAWIEVVRATHIRDTARNDTWSLVVTIVAFVLFVGVSSFGTTAFMIVAIVGFGDVLLDRYVGQAVARRDFGGILPGGGG